jgi:hypothetical protein
MPYAVPPNSLGCGSVSARWDQRRRRPRACTICQGRGRQAYGGAFAQISDRNSFAADFSVEGDGYVDLVEELRVEDPSAI